MREQRAREREERERESGFLMGVGVLIQFFWSELIAYRRKGRGEIKQILHAFRWRMEGKSREARRRLALSGCRVPFVCEPRLGRLRLACKSRRGPFEGTEGRLNTARP
eukprot:scaffold182030_cov28-Tisochrysis_lutea.AAC.4